MSRALTSARGFLTLRQQIDAVILQQLTCRFKRILESVGLQGTI